MPPVARPSRFSLRCMTALAALFVLYSLQSIWTHSLLHFDVVDFRVVYCGERAAIRERADPYRVEPLRSCEHRVKSELDEPVWSVTPFPLPGYTTAALSPLGFLPFSVARVAWIALLVLSFALAAAAVATILDVSAFAVGLVFAPTLGILNLHYGEPVLVSVAAVCLAALAVHGRRPKLAALAAALAMIEPHVGLPAALGVFVFVPEARRTLAVAAAVLAAVSLVTLGLRTNLEYARGFLPAQATAELIADDQFSLAHVAYFFGAPVRTALALGSFSYAAMTLLGLWLARGFVRRSLTPALFVLVPVALAMIGGPFIHDVQIAAALPAALVLARSYWPARAGVALLALDWSPPASHLVVPAILAAVGASFIVLGAPTPARRTSYVAAIAAGVLALALALPLTGPTLSYEAARATPAIASTELSSVPWGLRIAATPAWSENTLRTVLVKVPIWAGLFLIPLSLFAFDPAASRRELPARTLASAPLIDIEHTFD
jgi:hypothetical protein